ncbi:MAG: sensor histidine kinase [Candidatus Polarisedimenticolia bacterium]
MTRRLALFWLLVMMVTETPAVERLTRRFDERDGLPAGAVYSLAQDARGFLWVGTGGGLVRYDGVRMRRWDQGRLRDVVDRVTIGSADEVVALQRGDMFRVVDGEVEPYHGPDGRPLTKVRDVRFSEPGDLWMLCDAELLVHRAQKDWVVVDGRRFASERPRLLRGAPGDGILLLTNRGVHHLTLTGDDRLLARIDSPVDAILQPDGSLLVLTFLGSLVRFSHGHAETLFSFGARGIDLESRGDTVWVSMDRFLAAVRPSEPPEILGPQDRLPSGGPLVVDREGSLWLGTYLGLLQFPEPETVLFNDADGLPAHTRFVARTDEAIWVSTWQGLGRLDKSEGRWRAHASEMARDRACVDVSGRLWTGGADGAILERTQGRFIRHRPPPGWNAGGSCSQAQDGGVWMVGGTVILRVPPGARSPVEVSGPAKTGVPLPYESILETSDGALWVSQGDRFCHAPVREALLAPTPDSWSCETVPGIEHVYCFVEAAPGSLWMSGRSGGLHRRTRDRWERVPGSLELPANLVRSLRPAVSGGVWVAAQSAVLRVTDRPDLPAGWQVLERLTWWHGLPFGGSSDVLEARDGTLWLATSAGVVKVPPQARRAPMKAPPVEVTDVLVDDQRLDPHGRSLLPYSRNRLELQFAALSFRDPTLLNYRVRLRPDDPWSQWTQQPVIRFVDLPSGPFSVEVGASLDGESWTPEPARFAFDVDRPFYLRVWFLSSSAGLLVAGAFVTYRARVAFLIRMERQRARIAMDLHDEMGSTLGSIGILAGTIEGGGVDDGRRGELAHRIAEAASELGNALSDIVWSLRPGSTRLVALADHLAERASRLFPGSRPALAIDFPEHWPHEALPLGAVRSLQMIAVEALHNAARHAGAHRVTLGMRCPEGDRWCLWVEDDGAGLPAGAAPTRGMGLASMRRRAEEIGGDLTISAPAAGGTRVQVLFETRTAERRLKRRGIA